MRPVLKIEKYMAMNVRHFYWVMF